MVKKLMSSISIPAILLVSALFMGGCARGCESFDRDFVATSKKVIVRQYSGGKVVGKWEFHGVVNSSAESDGYYFRYGKKMIEVSGDVRIEYPEW